jgi:hypothetical protein
VNPVVLAGGKTDMTKLTSRFRKFSTAPKNGSFIREILRILVLKVNINNFFETTSPGPCSFSQILVNHTSGIRRTNPLGHHTASVSKFTYRHGVTSPETSNIKLVLFTYVHLKSHQ